MSRFEVMSDSELWESANFRFGRDSSGRGLVYTSWVSGMSKYRIGQPVGAPDGNGYLTVHFHGKQVKVHQISFLLEHKRWPTLEIDHLDRDILNNNPINLEESTSRNNQLNRSNNVEKLYLYSRADNGKVYIKVRDPNLRKAFSFGTYNTASDAEETRSKVESMYPRIAEAHKLYLRGEL